jgi:hypothetical protein
MEELSVSAKINIDYPNDLQARRRLRIIMNYFYDDSYDIVKQIYKLSPEFIRFCYKALGIRHEYKIILHDTGFEDTPHTDWSVNTKGSEYVKELLFEIAFRMLQEVFNGFKIINGHTFIKHVNKALSVCRVCEIAIRSDQSIMTDLIAAKTFFLWFLRDYLHIEVYDDLYNLAMTDNDIYTCIYYYNCIYGLKYDYVRERDVRNSMIKLTQYNTMLDQRTLDELEHAIDVKYSTALPGKLK